MAHPLIDSGEEEWESFATVPEDDLKSGVGVENTGDHEAECVGCGFGGETEGGAGEEIVVVIYALLVWGRHAGMEVDWNV